MVGDITLCEHFLNSIEIQNIVRGNEFAFCTNMYLIRHLLSVSSLLEIPEVYYRLYVIVLMFVYSGIFKFSFIIREF